MRPMPKEALPNAFRRLGGPEMLPKTTVGPDREPGKRYPLTSVRGQVEREKDQWSGRSLEAAR